MESTMQACRRSSLLQLGLIMLAAKLLVCSITPSARADFYINEIYFDPPGGGDIRFEYVELRGEPNAPLTDMYLILIENEDNAAFNGPAGMIDNIFDLGNFSLGSNGFITFRQKNPLAPHPVNPAATNLVNTGTGSGFGSGSTSSIGATDSGTGSDPVLGQIENGGFTAALIRNVSGSAPVVDFDLDVGNDGLDITPETSGGWWGQIGWELIDAVGVHSDFDESDFGRLYAPVNFGGGLPIPGGTAPRVPEGAEYVVTDWEIEYIGRWGNSTGQTSADWHASNLTDNLASGFSNVMPDFRQSGDPHPFDDGDPTTPPAQPSLIESSQNVPYGTPLTLSLGGPNYITGDYNGDGYVDAADYTVWRDTLGTTGTSAAIPAADHNHDYAVTPADYDIWRTRFGSPFSSGVALAGMNAGNTTVPEPSAAALLLLAVGALLAARRGVGAA
jgi:hypothetical protein